MVSMATIYFLNCFGYTFTRARSMQNFRRLSVLEILVALNFKALELVTLTRLQQLSSTGSSLYRISASCTVTKTRVY